MEVSYMKPRNRLRQGLVFAGSLILLMGTMGAPAVYAEQTDAALSGEMPQKNVLSDGLQTELDLSLGSITITSDQATVGSTVYSDPDGFTIYSSVGASTNTITLAGNNVAVTLRDVSIKSDKATPLRVKAGAWAVVTLEGTNSLGNGWDDVHTTNIVLENSAQLTLTGGGNLICRESLSKNKLSVDNGAQLTVRGCSVTLRSSYVPVVGGTGSIHVDGGYLSLRTDSSSQILCESGLSVQVTNGGTLAIDERNVNFGASSLSLSNGTLLTTGNGSVNLNPASFSMTNSQIHIAGSIAETLKQDCGSWSGLVFEGSSGTVYGKYTLPDNYEISSGQTLTILSDAELTVGHTVTLNGKLKNDGELKLPDQKAIAGRGSLTGDGIVTFSMVYPEISVPELVYDGTDLTRFIPADIPSIVTLCGKTIPISGFTMDGWTPSYQCGGASVDQVVDAGRYTVSYTQNGKTESKEFTVAPKELTVQSAQAMSKEYDATEQVSVVSVILDGAVAGDDVLVDILGLTGALPGAGAGNYDEVTLPQMTLIGEDAHNYALEQPTEAVPLVREVTIAKAAPVVTNVRATSSDTLYNTTDISAITLTYNGTPGTVKLDKDQSLKVGTTEYRWTFTPADAANYTSVAGTVKLTVTEDFVTGIAVTRPPDKQQYIYGDRFDAGGMVITATYVSGKTDDVTAESIVTPEVPDAGTAQVTIRYGSLTTACPITVLAKEISQPVIEWEGGTSFVYTGGKIEPAVTVKYGGEVIPPDEYSVRYTDNIDAGEALITITDLAGGNYTVNGTASFSITKAASVVTKAPAANALTYNGQAQALVTAGDAVGGTMLYSLSQNGPYSSNIPCGTAAGKYTVWYKVAGDGNHLDTQSRSVDIEIKSVSHNEESPSADKTPTPTPPSVSAPNSNAGLAPQLGTSPVPQSGISSEPDVSAQPDTADAESGRPQQEETDKPPVLLILGGIALVLLLAAIFILPGHFLRRDRE